MICPENRLSDFESQLIQALRPISTEISAWVILPNHYHILLGVDSLDDVSAVLQAVHGSTSYRWNLEDGQQGKRKVWYHFTDRSIRCIQQYYQTINYIHYNPIKHQYINDAYAWQWSSLALYEQDYGRDWLRDIWKQYMRGDFSWNE